MPLDREGTLRKAEKLLRQGRLEAAIAEYVRVVEDQPRDWTTANTLGDLYVRAAQSDKAAAQYRRIAEHFTREGFYPKAAALYKKILRILPEDESTQLQLADLSLKQGLLVDARAYFKPVAARRHSRGDRAGAASLLVAVAEIDLRSGELQQAGEILRQALALDRAQQDPVVALTSTLAGRNPEAAYVCVEAVVNALAAASELREAAKVLQEFVARAPAQIPALVKLVETCADAGLEKAMCDAQAQLADAYLAGGQAAAARGIAEDLVAREPWERAHIERFRRALVDLRVPDPEAVIAERLSGPAPVTRKHPSSPEVDLTGALGKLDAAQPEAVPAPSQPAPSQPAPSGRRQTLDDVFEGVRSDLLRQKGPDQATRQMTLARTYLEMGLTDEAIECLKTAVRSPRRRFEAGVALGRLYKERGDIPQAIEWMQRASEAPAASPEESRALLYELGTTLENAREFARALGVFLQLQADAGEYRDVSARVDRLARVQTGG